MDWEIQDQGFALSAFEILTITDAVKKMVSKNNDLISAASSLSSAIGSDLGLYHWNVLIIQGNLGRKSFASGGYYISFKRNDDLMVYIWLNRLVIIFVNLVDR